MTGRGRKRLPHIGQRIIKTAIAVFICLVIYYLRGYQTGETMPSEAAITAIICMQPFVRDMKKYALFWQGSILRSTRAQKRFSIRFQAV